MTIKRDVDISSQSILDSINKKINPNEINQLSTLLQVEVNTVSNIITTTISTVLVLLIRSDFREHLQIAEIISGNQVWDALDMNQSNKRYKSVGAKELSHVLLKKQGKTIVHAMNEKYKLSEDDMNMLFQHGVQYTLEYLYNITRVNKLNVRGIISHLETQHDELTKHIEPIVLKNIKKISLNNRKRTSNYTRGPVFKNNYAVYFPVLVVVMIVALYFFLYLNHQ
jgi:hypothetical protein